MLARADGSPQPFYSLSAHIQRQRNDCYDMLERTQHGDMEVTEWLHWFLQALMQANQTRDAVLQKAHFWQRLNGTHLNQRQVKVLNRMLDGFDGKLTRRK